MIVRSVQRIFPCGQGAKALGQGNTRSELICMIIILFCAIIFYYLASLKYERKLILSLYISQDYLFVVAHNVGFLKRFSGL
jgi:hypothetical protein